MSDNSIEFGGHEFDASERKNIRKWVSIVSGNGSAGLVAQVQQTKAQVGQIKAISIAIGGGVAALFLQGVLQVNPPSPGHTIITPQNAAPSSMTPQNAADGGDSPIVSSEGTPTAAALRGGYTTSEYAELADISVRTVQQYCKDGKLDCYVAENGAYLIRIADNAEN